MFSTNTVMEGDCLEVMKTLPDSSIDLIATDPPYFKIKGNGGGSKGQFEWWDRQWDKPVEFLKWIDQLAEQWQRILKPNGSLYCFASPKMSARVEVLLAERFSVLNNITWAKPPYSTKAEMSDKETMRGYFPVTESIIFCEHYGADNAAKGEAGYWQKCGELHQKVFGRVFGEYLAAEIDRAGATRKEIAALFPSRSGGLTGCVSNWVLGNNCPSQEQYETIKEYLNSKGGEYLRREYEELRYEYEELRYEYEDLRQQYEDLRRPFSVSADVPYTDVWTYPTVSHYPGKHPCEKPLEMMEHIVQASSRPGGVILDCFCGSGNTLVAAKKHDRQFIGIDIDPHWVDVAKGKLGQTQRFVSTEDRLQWLETQVQAQGTKIKRLENQQLDLFHIGA